MNVHSSFLFGSRSSCSALCSNRVEQLQTFNGIESRTKTFITASAYQIEFKSIGNSICCLLVCGATNIYVHHTSCLCSKLQFVDNNCLRPVCNAYDRKWTKLKSVQPFWWQMDCFVVLLVKFVIVVACFRQQALTIAAFSFEERK